jgi:hypothetical protein
MSYASRLKGETFPRLQMRTPTPPFEGGPFEETLLVDLKDNRLRLGTEGGRFRVRGRQYRHDRQWRGQELRQSREDRHPRFLPSRRRSSSLSSTAGACRNLLLREALDRTNSLRYLGDDEFEGRHQDVLTFVMPDTQQVALYIDATTGLVSKYELLTVDSLTGVEASEIIFSDYQKLGNYQVPRAGRTSLRATTRLDTPSRRNSIRRSPMPPSASMRRAMSRSSRCPRTSRRRWTRSLTAST